MKSWLPTFSLAFASFIFVTSEFTPVGLLTEIGASLGRDASQTGMLLTVYAWIVALFSLPLTAYVARFDRRPLMLAILGIFTLAHAIAAFALSFETLVVSRFFVACGHAIFWAIAVPLGIRLAPPGGRERAMSIVATGATLGGVLGIPLSTYFGQIFGWRPAFAAIGVVAAGVGFLLHRLLPPAPSRGGGSFATIGILWRRPRLVLVYLLTFLTMTGQYTTYTYISPFLGKVGGYPKEMTGTLLLAFGVAGFVASGFAPWPLKIRFRATALLCFAIVTASLALLGPAAANPVLLILLAGAWGAAFMFVNLVLQSLVLLIAPDAEDVAMAGFSGIYNLGIGSGALFGGIAAAHALPSIGFIGAGFGATACGLALGFLRNWRVVTTGLDPRAGH